MNKLRALTLLALVTSYFGFDYAFENIKALIPGEMSAPVFLLWFFALAALIVLNAVSIISSTMILLLSFFAVKQEEDGMIVISEDSRYGKLFAAIAELSEGKNYSLCLIFWKTNWVLIRTGFVIGVLCFLAYHALKNWYSAKAVFMGVGIVAAFFLVVILGIFLGEFLVKYVSRSKFGIFYDKYLCPRIRIKRSAK